MKITRRFGIVERQDIVEKASECLWTDEATEARQYLVDKRNLSEDVIKEFRLGYIPENVNHQLQGRIILPLFDASGNLISVTSRLIRQPNETDILPVYWHEAYEKSFYLYGINVAKTFMRKWRFAIVVEGQFDVLQLNESGLQNSVALCSTNLSDFQLAVIYRYCDEVVLLLDNDQAGNKASDKILKKYTKHSIDRVSVNGLTDADEFIRNRGFAPLRSQIKHVVKGLRKNVR